MLEGLWGGGKKMSINNLHRVNKDDCALIIIDMQNDFIAEGAPIECPGGREIVPKIQRIKKWAKENSIPVFYTQEMHRYQKNRLWFGT